MQHFQIRLTPVEYFFFGGEKHVANPKDGSLQANYFVESNAYPQQTTLLGLLRYYLLLRNPDVFSGNRIRKKDEAGALIGTQSFDFPTPLSFGKIHSLTPLYFFKGNVKYFFGPLDSDFSLTDDYRLAKGGERYNYREHGHLIGQCLYSEDGETKVSLEAAIKDIVQTGNEKGDNGESKEDAYYKQVMKRFAESGWSFAFDAALEDGSNIQEETLYLPFGGEKCFFKMEIKATGEQISPSYPDKLHSRTVYSLLCVSDCFVDWEGLKCDFAVNSFTGFRNFRSTTETANADAFNDNIKHGQIRSNRYNLLQRGSVLYFKDAADCKAAKKAIEKISTQNAEEEQPARTIGFNHTISNKQP